MVNDAAYDLSFLEPKPLGRIRWPVLSIAPDLSGTCNLACRYCAEAASQPRRPPMKPETLDEALKFLFRGAKRLKNTLSIRLGSGEPLLAFPLMQHLANRLNEENESAGNKTPKVFLTTNGTLISDEIQDWLVTSGWNIKISLDGPKAIHDKWRVTPRGLGTFDSIADRVSYLSARVPERLSVTAVLCRENDPKDVFDSIAALNVPRIELVPVAHSDNKILPTRDDIKRYQKFLKTYVQYFLSEDVRHPPPMLIGLEKCAVRLMGYNLGRIACGAGRSFVGVCSQGDLYPCFRFIGIDKYKLGSLEAGLNIEAIRTFKAGPGRCYEYRQACSRCWAAPICTGPCFACTEIFGPGNYEPIEVHCAYSRVTAEAAIQLVNQLREQFPQRLLWFLPRVDGV